MTRATRETRHLAGSSESSLARSSSGDGKEGGIRPPHHVCHELDRLFRRVGNQSGEGRGRELGELEVHGGGELESLAPLSLVGRPEDRADLEYFIDFGAAWEERPKRVQLRHDASHRPTVAVFCELLFRRLV